ncbi:hypothetical protein MRX96_055924 [Rhipicephalus microplus]
MGFTYKTVLLCRHQATTTVRRMRLVQGLQTSFTCQMGGTNNGTPTEKAFMCRVEGCGKTYTTLHHLKVHGRAHTGDRPFKCLVDGCNKSFVTGYGLKSHTRVHTGETPYRCTHDGCIKTFKTSGDLQKHVRTHTGERPFKCPFEDCNREKPYVCTVPSCGKRFTEYSSLYKHHVVHTHNKPYMCNLCGKNYRQTSTLAMHKRTAHGLLIDDARLELGVEEEEMEGDLDEAGTIQDAAGIMEETSPTGRRRRAGGHVQHTQHYNIGGLGRVSFNPAVHFLSLQEDGTLVQTPSGQQILLVANPAQLLALQQLALQQDQTLALADQQQDSLEGEDVVIATASLPDN